MSGWPEVELGEICEFKYGKSLPAEARDGGPFSVYGSNGVVGSHSAAITGAPVVIIGRKGSFGEIEYSTSPCWPIDTTYFVDSTATKTDLKWLSYRLRGLGLTTLNRAAAIPGLNREDAYRQRLLLPPLDEQRRIAAILDQADALRAKRRQVLAHLDALNQSIFHDMFGDLVHGNWQVEPLGLLSPRIDSGTSPVCETRAALPGEWGVLKLGAVTYGEFRGSENKAYLGDVTSMLGNEVKPGDVLMTRKNTRDLVGAVAVVEDHVISGLLIPDLVFRLHLDRERLDAEYFHTLMMTPVKRAIVKTLASGSAGSMPNISKARLRGLAIELPPMELQREFARRIASGKVQKANVQRMMVDCDTLFTALQSRAFRGEL